VHVSTNQLINAARVLADPSQHALLQALAPLPPRLLPKLQQQHAVPKTAAADGTQQQQGGGGSHQRKHHHQSQQQPQPEQQQQHNHQQQQQPEQQQPSAAILTGEDYYAAKESLFLAEQVVLRRMRFQLGDTAQPHKHLLNFCRLLGLARATAADAVATLNDALSYTRLACDTQPGVLAAAALQHVLQLHRAATAGAAAAAAGASATDDQWVRLVGLPPPAVTAAQQVLQALYGA
jgi:hypothetical protein